MNSKLTLSINQMVIEEAKVYAKSSGKSLSGIVEEYLKSLTQREGVDKKKKSLKVVRELKGCVKINKELSYKELLEDALIEKYLGK